MHGTRICIIGNSGSGKSSLAKALGKKLDVPVYHLDRHLTSGNFEKLPSDEYRSVHAKLIEGESWIIEGNYKKTLEERIARATLVAFLDIGRVVALARVLKRTHKGGHDADTIPSDAKPDAVSWEFLKWTGGYSRRERKAKLRSACDKVEVPFLAVKNQSLEKMVELIRKEIGSC